MSRGRLPKSAYSGSLTVPVTAENRIYLRMLRHMELNAWRSAKGAHDEISAGDLHSSRAKGACWGFRRGRGFRLSGFLVLLVAVIIGYGGVQLCQLIEKLPGLVQVIREFVG